MVKDYKLIVNNHRVQEMFMYDQFKHMVKEIIIHINHLHFLLMEKSSWMGVRPKEGRGKGILLGPNSPINSIPVLGQFCK